MRSLQVVEQGTAFLASGSKLVSVSNYSLIQIKKHVLENLKAYVNWLENERTRTLQTHLFKDYVLKLKFS